MGLFDEVFKQADSDVGKVVDVLQGVRRRIFAKCSACADTGIVKTAQGERICSCDAGRIVDPNKRLPR